MKKVNFLSMAPVVSRIKIPVCCLIFYCLAFSAYGQDNLLRRRVSVEINDQSLEQALLDISNNADFTFSYDASILEASKKTSVRSSNQTVKSNLDQILPPDIEYKVSGNHLILLKKTSESNADKKEKINISGLVKDRSKNQPLTNVVVFEVSSLTSATTNQNGEFSFSVPAEFEKISLSINKKAYQDTIIFLPNKDQYIKISLSLEPQLSPAQKVDKKSPDKNSTVEELSVVQKIVPSQAMLRTNNTDLIRTKTAQVSFVPIAGTNLKMSGSVKNKFSLNILAGYSYGVGAFELGGLFNVVRHDVSGAQIGGLANIVGNNTRGFQLGGIFNHNKGSFVGAQIGGIHNLVTNELVGLQFAGIDNVLKGKMNGIQIAGIGNLTTQNVDGVQFAGIANIAAQDVRKLQIAGIVNQGKNVRGVQFAGIGNQVTNDVRGVQIGGIYNWGERVDAVQFAGIANFATEEVSGVQIAGILNYAKNVKGNQIGLINIADSSSGTPIGLISIVKTGLHTPEISSNEILPYNFSYKFGVKRLYNIFTVGGGSWNGKSKWAFGYGIGNETRLGEKSFLSFEYTANWVNEGNEFREELSLLNKINVNYGKRLGKKFALTIGPSLNIWVSEWKDPNTDEYLTELAPYTIYEDMTNTSLVQMWIGGKVGVHW